MNVDILDKIRPIIGNTVNDVARATLHSMFPNEFEMYMVTLELTDIQGKTLDLFTFPINPKSISKTEPYTKSINRTYNNVVISKNGTFTPRDISVRGNFGRSFKVLQRTANTVFRALRGVGELAKDLKSGYGCLKVLQSICQSSNELDAQGNPYLLYFHNYTLGESYLVEVMDLTIDLDTSMLYSYNLRLKIVKEVELGSVRQTILAGNIIKRTIQNAVQKGISISENIVSNITGGLL